MKNTICDKNKCTACGACLNICPKKCVYYKKDGVGHLYPVIDESKCIHCHACEKVCQVLHPLELEKPKTAYAGWHHDVEEYKSSTSGGAATAFAQKIISEGGVVYGWHRDMNWIRHILSKNLGMWHGIWLRRPRHWIFLGNRSCRAILKN